MFDLDNPILWLAIVLSLAVLGVLARHYLRSEARRRRRRDHSHGSVISRRRGPTIKLAVKVNEPRRKRER